MSRPIPGLPLRASDADPTRRFVAEVGDLQLAGPTALWEPCAEETLVVATGTPDPHWQPDLFERGPLAPQTFLPVCYGVASGKIPVGGVPILRRARNEDLPMRVEYRRARMIDQTSESSGAAAEVNVGGLPVGVVPGSEVEDAMRGITLTPPPSLRWRMLGILYHATYYSPFRPGGAPGPMEYSTADAVPLPTVSVPPDGARARDYDGTGGIEGQIDGQDRLDVERVETTAFLGLQPFVVASRLVRVSVGVLP
jgi:hypothetical protein